PVIASPGRGNKSGVSLVAIKQLTDGIFSHANDLPRYGGTAVPAPLSASPPEPKTAPEVGSRYKWIALSNTTLGVLMVTINSSIVLIALPNIFRGIGINPLQPGNTTIF